MTDILELPEKTYDQVWIEGEINGWSEADIIPWFERVKAYIEGLNETIKNGNKQEKAYRAYIDELKEKAEKYEDIKDILKKGGFRIKNIKEILEAED